MRSLVVSLCAALLAIPATARAQSALTVVTAQPSGEIASLAEAAEIRVRFSEAMVPIGRIPDQVTAPFFTVQPRIAGTFRWAGPTILVFTPNPATPLPTATRYDVTIAATATAVSGHRLERAYTFSFTTPTVRLLATEWYRTNGRADQRVAIPLRFNQPVRPADVLAHTTARYERYEWHAPQVSAQERTRMGAAEAAKFDAKVAAANATASSVAAVPLRLAADWDKRRFPPSPDLVVLETVSPPASGGRIRIAVDAWMPAVQGRATPPQAQSHAIELEPVLFVEPFRCTEACDADGFNYARLRGEVPLDALKRAATIRDITSAGPEAVVRPLATPRDTYRSRQEAVEIFTPEDLGYNRQTPARTWAYTIDGGLTAVDGQTLGYTWTGIVENWHDRAFVSFGDGHGVWEKDSGPLPFDGRNFPTARQWVQRLTPQQLMPTILNLEREHFRAAPTGPGVQRPLGVVPDRIQSHGLNLSSALGPSGTGLVGRPFSRARRLRRRGHTSTRTARSPLSFR
jgi:hypothetical protein